MALWKHEGISIRTSFQVREVQTPGKSPKSGIALLEGHIWAFQQFQSQLLPQGTMVWLGLFMTITIIIITNKNNQTTVHKI